MIRSQNDIIIVQHAQLVLYTNLVSEPGITIAWKASGDSVGESGGGGGGLLSS